MKRQNYLTTLLLFLSITFTANAWVGSAMPRLHVDGRYLKDSQGNIVNLHGFAQTYSPWFNEQGTQWSNYDVSGCLKYNQKMIDGILAAGWKVNFIRLHMDPYWSNLPGCSTPNGEASINCFSETRFRKYLDEVFIPMAEYAVSKGLYVIMRPPGVCPDKIAVMDDYNKYLIKVWSIVSQHSKLKNHPNIMFELANEPVNILGPDGSYGSSSQGQFDNLKKYFQSVVDTIRASGSENILWVPGLGYQSRYKGYAINPIEGNNIGYAIHVYPGWFGSQDGGNTSTLNGYDGFKAAWDSEIKPVANFAPICVTEMDWAPAKYNASWGKAITGEAGGTGFGANFKRIMDETGNVSWLIFTDPWRLAQFSDPPAASDTLTFLSDPQACPWPTYHWYQEYASVNYPRPEFTYQSHSDNGDGTFTNPLIMGDFPDPDVIRVDDTYYMVSTTMHIFPGATILKSKDLVNWEYCSNPLEKIETTSCYNLDGCNVYGHGQWASSLKYHDGKFYLLFNTLDNGSYLLTATDPEGTWTKKKLTDSFYDPGLLFDDDKIYVVYGINELHIAQLDENFNKINDQKVYTYTVKSGLEGSHLYKINGYYYIYSTYGGYPAYQTVMRSQNIFGPYEEKLLLNDNNIHQGALVETQTGEWWTVLFQDKGAFGRLPNLQPITWTNNWPVIGDNGKAVTTYTKPNVGKSFPVESLPTNDSFRSYKLGMQWGWNHNPDNTKWSLTERPNFLRLRTVSVTDSLIRAKNTLTQRILAYPSDLQHSYGTIKMHINNMLEGDVAGLAVFQDPYGYIGIKVINGLKKIVQVTNNVESVGPAVTDSVVYLRAVANFNNSTADFQYSTDNTNYISFGSALSMKFNLSVFTGNKFCLFNFPTVNTGGYVDIDWFTTEKDFTQDQFYDSSFEAKSTSALTLTGLQLDKSTKTVLTGSSTSLTVNAVYADGHTEDVSIGATYETTGSNIVRIVNGNLIAESDGETDIQISYKGLLGNIATTTLHVISTTFPLVSGTFNPSIYETGTFDEATRTLKTGVYGFGGWQYTNGVDLSNYKYLVAKLGSNNTSAASFRIYDENSYWSQPVIADFGSTQQVVVNLQSALKNQTTTKISPSHIYIVGFWSYGNNPIVIDDVYLTNSETYEKDVAGIDEISKDVSDMPQYVDVYTVMGIKVRNQVKFDEALKNLPPGVYIVGKKKYMIIH